MLAGNYRKADALTSQYLSSDRQGFGYFSNVGHLTLHFRNKTDTVTGYRRGLELADGYGFVKYRCGDTDYLRTYFCSYPDKVMAVRLSASKPGSLSLDIAHSFTHPVLSSDFDKDGTWTVKGNIADNGLKYTVRMRVESKGGEVRPQDGKLSVEKADEVCLYYAIDTDYLQNPPSYRGENPDKNTEAAMKKVRKEGYDRLLERHLADFRGLFQRMEFNLKGDAALEKLSTGQRLEQFRKGATDDSALKALWFNYGRYMMISASRSLTLPSNLQGVWNGAPQAAWGGNFQSNINLQEMYWSCGRCASTNARNPISTG